MEKFFIQIDISAFKNEYGYAPYDSKLRRCVEINTTHVEGIPEALASAVRTSVAELIAELIQADVEANREDAA